MCLARNSGTCSVACTTPQPTTTKRTTCSLSRLPPLMQVGCCRDPVYDFAWLQSKTGSELMSVSSDGQCLWWDVRKLGEPLETLTLKVCCPCMHGKTCYPCN